MANKTWFITGTSRGFGREWTKAALERGDRVAATARDTSTLDDLRAEHGDALLALTLDVTDREAAFGAVAQAHEHFGGWTSSSTMRATATSGWWRRSQSRRLGPRSRPICSARCG
jgi:NAD(P)-dependent dehydrogenase (short-subunit alcohol dehydrogenase family)